MRLFVSYFQKQSHEVLFGFQNLFSNPRTSKCLESVKFPIKEGNVSFQGQTKFERELS